MRKTIEKKKKNKLSNIYKNMLQIFAVGCVTGVCAGAVVTIFNILAEKGETLSSEGYAYVRANPAFIPLLVLALALGAFLLGVALQISSVIRGCGIPQAEGAARGSVRFRWFRDTTAMFAASLLNIFMGLSIGAEGPSVLIGAGVGDGVASLLHRNEMIKRYQITGGACTGLAVASNAPLTGIVFAFEEAYKRFTPEVFVCAFSSVIFGVLTRSAIYRVLGLQIQSAFHSYIFYEMPETYYIFVLIAGLVCGLVGMSFIKICLKMRKVFAKIVCKKQTFTYAKRVAIAVFLGGAVCFLAAGVMGGGHGLIEDLGTLGGAREPVMQSAFGLSLVWTLLIALALKFFITCVNVGSGIPCGIFIPIIAIGACLGGLLNRAFIALGMDARYGDLLIMICMAATFTAIVRAPLTAIIMICEFTGSFAPLLPVIIGVAIGYAVGEATRTDGIYELLLEAYEHESGIHERAVREVYTLTLNHGATAEGRTVRDVLWPSGARVKELHRGEEVILPDGNTILRAGDILTIVCKTDEPKKVKDDLTHILG